MKWVGMCSDSTDKLELLVNRYIRGPVVIADIMRAVMPAIRDGDSERVGGRPKVLREVFEKEFRALCIVI